MLRILPELSCSHCLFSRACVQAEVLLSSPHRPQMCAQLGGLGADTNSLLSMSGGRPTGASGHGVYASPARKLAAINSRISATRSGSQGLPHEASVGPSSLCSGVLPYAGALSYAPPMPLHGRYPNMSQGVHRGLLICPARLGLPQYGKHCSFWHAPLWQASWEAGLLGRDGGGRGQGSRQRRDGKQCPADLAPEQPRPWASRGPHGGSGKERGAA